MTLLVGVVTVACIALGLRGYWLMRAPQVPGASALLIRGGSTEVKVRQSLVGRFLGFVDRVIGGRVLGQMNSSSRARVREAIARAGSPEGMTVESLIQRQSTWATMGLVLAVLLVRDGQIIGVVLPVVGWFLPRYGLWAETRRRTHAIERELPDFLDVLAVTISAGLGFRTGLRRVSSMVTGVVAEEMLVVLRQIDLGASRRAAFDDLRRRTSAPSLHRFITAFLQAEELGTPISGFLDSYSRELRRSAGQRARTAAARANPKISLVLTLMIMPAISLFMVGSLLLMSFKGL